MSTPPSLSIVLPCYNEAASLPAIFSRFREVLAGREDVEVVFVDNGSTDSSAAVLADLCADADHAWARAERVPVNRGYGFGIMAGIRAARGEVLSWTHADMQTDPADVLAAYAVFAAQSDPTACFLKGRRVGRGFFDAFFTGGMSLLSSLALGRRLHDVNAQPKMFHRRFLERMTDPPDDFSLDLYVYFLARSPGMTLLTHPVRFGRREHGQAKGGGSLRGKIRLILRTCSYIRLLRRRLRTGRAGRPIERDRPCSTSPTASTRPPN